MLDRIWEKVPKVNEEESQADIKQAITEVRSDCQKTQEENRKKRYSECLRHKRTPLL